MGAKLPLNEIRHFSKWSAFRLHAKAEWSIFWQIKWQVISIIFILYFVFLKVFRIWTFQRHVPGKRLKDLGFDLLPEKDLALLSDCILGTAFLLIGGMCGAGLWNTLKTGSIEGSVFTVNILRRYLNVMAGAHFLRVVSYMSTSLPGPADHCQAGNPSARSPENLWAELFDRLIHWDVNKNCGDLIFSGHTLQTVAAVLLATKYAHKVFPRSLANAYTCFSWLLIPLLTYSIISARRHYTVDVTIGIWATILVFLVYNDRIQPNDIKPEDSDLDVKSLAPMTQV
jgi:hypothetical protein